MSYGAYSFNKLQLGVESTSGTAVPATNIWRGAFGDIEDARTREQVEEQVGLLVPAERIYESQLDAMISIPATPATYEQLPYVFEAGIETVSPSGTASPYTYAYAFPTSTTLNTIATYTFEAGNAIVTGDIREAEYCFVESFTLSGSMGEPWMVSSNWHGRQVAESSFTSALTLQAVEEIMFNNTEIYIDDSGGTVGTTQLTGVLMDANIDVTTGVVPVYTADGNLFFTSHKFIPPEITFTFTMELESDNGHVKAERDEYEADNLRLIQFKVPGTSSRDLEIRMAAKYDNVNPYGNTDENTTVQFEGHAVYSSTDTLFYETDVLNTLSALV